MMNILAPMAALALMTLIVAFYLGKVRFAAIKSGEMTELGYFTTFKGDSPEPENVQKVQRNYYNLLTSPVLFYAACAAALALDLTDPILIYLAWGYVAIRAIHSLIHITSNVVIARFRLFALSLLMLTAIWIRLLMVGM